VHKTHTVSDYLQKAAHNLEFAQYVRKNKTDCLDWAATSLFYSAVHYLNAYFVNADTPIPRRHTSSDPNYPGRKNIIQQDPQLLSIYSHYRHLDDESRDARYELRIISAADYDSFLLPKLNSIKSFITTKVTI